MTVRCLNPEQKKQIAAYYSAGFLTIKQLEVDYRVSRRTIIRVLEEEGVAPVIRRRKPAEPPINQGSGEQNFITTILMNWCMRIYAAINRFISSKPTH